LVVVAQVQMLLKAVVMVLILYFQQLQVLAEVLVLEGMVILVVQGLVVTPLVLVEQEQPLQFKETMVVMVLWVMAEAVAVVVRVPQVVITLQQQQVLVVMVRQYL
jgi:hypothetical protein